MQFARLRDGVERDGRGRAFGRCPFGRYFQPAGMHHRGRIQLLQITQLATRVSLKKPTSLWSDFHIDAALFKM